MALPQDISPVNPELMDTLVKSKDMDWIPQPLDPEKAFMKVLWTCQESGRWLAHFKWLKGFVAPQHKHLSAAHTFVLYGKLQVRDGILETGDYVYERNGMIHGATTALEDTRIPLPLRRASALLRRRQLRRIPGLGRAPASPATARGLEEERGLAPFGGIDSRCGRIFPQGRTGPSTAE